MEEIKKTLIEMLTKPVENNFVGWLSIALLWLLFLMLAAIIIYGILAAINYWFRPKKEGYGQIVATVFEPSHYSSHFNAATKTMMTTLAPQRMEADY